MGWKDFEWDCYNYLCDKYGSERVRFMKLGESDSTQSDIFVSILEERNFYIETKEAKAQCGQFVVLPNDSKAVFEYSADNRYP
ncbi:MAG: hypothetical protein K2N34_06345, partial [Lachnospiraceae bacterium]|nr:hypothetical protein [Lachnospiraceae bacterium]